MKIGMIKIIEWMFALNEKSYDLILCLFHFYNIFFLYFLFLSSYISFYFAYFPLFPNYGEAKLIHN